MKRTMVIAGLALAGFIAAGSAEARGQQWEDQTIQDGAFQQGGTANAYNISGAAYPIGKDDSEWGQDADTEWTEIGGSEPRFPARVRPILTNFQGGAEDEEWRTSSDDPTLDRNLIQDFADLDDPVF